MTINVNEALIAGLVKLEGDVNGMLNKFVLVHELPHIPNVVELVDFDTTHILDQAYPENNEIIYTNAQTSVMFIIRKSTDQMHQLGPQA